MANQTTTTTSGQFSLNVKDVAKGFLMAAIGTGVTALYEFIAKILVNGGGFNDIDWKLIGLGALSAGLGYIVKKFFQPPVIVIENPPKAVVEAVKNDEAEIKVVPK